MKNKQIILYCEGKKGSHDHDILNKLTQGLHHIIIKPLGGIKGAAAIIDYREKHEMSVVKPSFSLFFRDRDFDSPVPEVPKLEQDANKKKFYYSYRNTIENYLFSAENLYGFIKEKNLDNHYNIASEKDVEEKMIEAAKRIRYYQAVRHTLGYLRTGRTDFGTKLTSKSGELPPSLEEDYCKEAALKKLENARTVIKDWTPENFEKVYSDFFHKFDDAFIQRMDFLIYFQGKDFATSLKTVLSESFSLESYYKYAKKHFDYHKYQDLLELRKLLESRSR